VRRAAMTCALRHSSSRSVRGEDEISGQKPPEVISFHSVRLLLAGKSHCKSHSDVARRTVVPSFGMITQVLHNHG
jgi:hypothetical protein